MVEDFDDNGNIRSSLPAQFLAVIWTPEDYNLDSGRGLSTEGAARQYQVKNSSRISNNSDLKFSE